MEKTAQGELACRILELERSLDAYRQVHTEELDELARQLVACKQQILVLMAREGREGTEKNRTR